MNHEKPVVLITGASRGLGRAIAIDFGSREYHVIVNYRSERSEAELTEQLVREAGGTAEIRQADVSQADEVSQLFRQVNRVDVLINNAGITRDELFLMMKSQSWSSVIKTNLSGIYRCSKLAARLMVPQKNGTIINICSSTAFSARVGQANYSTSKSAMLGFSRSLSRELAPLGVSVVTVAPGFTATDMAEAVSGEVVSAAIDRTPLGRWANPQEVVKAVAFASSDTGRCFNGQTLLVDGGRTGFEVEFAL